MIYSYGANIKVKFVYDIQKQETLKKIFFISNKKLQLTL
jgi:hypothetical protein